MPIYDYECEKGHLIESRQNYDATSIRCPKCRSEATRLFSAEGQSFTGGPTGACGCSTTIHRDEKRYDVTLFQEACSEREYSHGKAEEKAQRKLPSENLWGKAKKRADRILAGKEPAVQAQTRFKRRKVDA